jgi:hypothetical protein
MKSRILKVHAQYPNSGDATPVAAYVVLHPQQNLTVYINIQTTGSARNLTADEIQTLATYGVILANQSFAEKGEGVRLTLTSNPSDANLIMNLNVVYNSDGSGAAYLEMRGLGVGHLFRFHRVSNPEEATVAVFTDLWQYLGNNGWTCGTGDGN